MVNNENGEVAVVIGDKTYTLVFAIDAMVAIQKMFSTPEKTVTFVDACKEVENQSVVHLQALLWSAFQCYHKEVQLDDVGALMQQLGGMKSMMTLITELMKGIVPDPRDEKALGIKPNANPQKARTAKTANGTGANSTSALAKPA